MQPSLIKNKELEKTKDTLVPFNVTNDTYREKLSLEPIAISNILTVELILLQNLIKDSVVVVLKSYMTCI